MSTNMKYSTLLAAGLNLAVFGGITLAPICAAADALTAPMYLPPINMGYDDGSVFVPTDTAVSVPATPALPTGWSCPNVYGYWSIGNERPGGKDVAKALVISRVAKQRVILQVSTTVCKNGYLRIEVVQLVD